MSSRLRSSTRASTAASTAASESLAETVTETKTRGDSRKSAAARPLKNSELARLTRIAVYAFLTSLALLGGAFYLVMSDKIQLYPSSIKLESLKGFNSRAEYALRYQTLLYAWLVFNVHAVIYVRLTRKALNPLVESTERLAQTQKNILTNSFEQIVISSFLQLIFVSFAEHVYTLKLIPAINVVQFLGRIAFFAGYPLYRTLGVGLTTAPNLALLCFNLYKLGTYLNFY